MSDVFSNQKIIDYFAILDFEILKLNEDITKKDMQIPRNSFLPISIQYQHKNFKIFPEKVDKKSSLLINSNEILNCLPPECVYLRKPPNKYFSLTFTNSTFL
jgi:hypothetical protein